MIKVATIIPAQGGGGSVPESNPTLKMLSDSIRARFSNMHKDALQIGRDLLQAKEMLGHGNFQPWLATEFAWSVRTAQNFMNVALRLGDKYESLSHLSVETLYKLAAPSTPKEVVVAIAAKAAAGEKVTPKVVAVMVRQSKPITTKR